VRYASQTFSATVAAGMRTCIKSGVLSSTAETTIMFIDYMDKLFDTVNSKPKEGSKDFSRPFKNNTSQRQHLLYMLDAFKCMRVLETKIVNGELVSNDVTHRIKFLKGLQITINSLLHLWDDIDKPPQYSLCTYKLNHDSLENLFGNFRNQNGNNVNSTPIQFLWTFKKFFSLNFFKHSDGANCLDDLDQILTKYISEVAPALSSIKLLFSDKNPFKGNVLNFVTVDYRNLCIPTKKCTCICFWLFDKKKCLEKNSCHVCLNYARDQNELDQSLL